jgi:gluconolactonase
MAFQSYHPSFDALVGEKQTIECLLTEDKALFHEASVFIHSTNELFVTSNRLRGEDGHHSVQISKVTLGKSAESTSWEPISGGDIVIGNGGVNYNHGILFCAQGGLQAPSGLYFMSLTSLDKTDLLVSGFYGRPFNSVNDVVVHSDGTIWFTDPTYGFEQGYRPKPQLPSQVYRFNPTDSSIRAVADGFGHPNGLCFSPDEQVLYVTDTDRERGDGSVHDTCPSSM